MVNIFAVESADERERFCSIAGLSMLTPEMVERSHADAHWILDEGDGTYARCSLWWTHAPSVPGQKIGLIGHYAACDAEAAWHLLQFACEELARQRCTLAVGPMDGSTHRRYRLLTERGTEPLFFLEPDNPDDWPEHFTGSGFSPLANYYSALQMGIERTDPRVSALAEQFAGEGVAIRTFDAAHFDEEVQRIYRVVSTSFQRNLLASPIAEEEFLEQNRSLRPYVRPELVLLAERAGEPVGFVFALLDWLQAQRGEPINTVIVKTLAVHPDYSGRGLATLLTGRLREIAHDLGYTRAIHALMHERNISRHMSETNRGRIIRRYTLYARKLEVQR
jgi:GNAT superfamily N-acetyltransferase